MLSLRQLVHRLYLWSPKWKSIRQRVLERDNYTCQNPQCGFRSKANQVHHIHYRSWLKEEEDYNSLITLCAHCHATLHGKTRTNNTPIPISEPKTPRRLGRRRTLKGKKWVS